MHGMMRAAIETDNLGVRADKATKFVEWMTKRLTSDPG